MAIEIRGTIEGKDKKQGTSKQGKPYTRWEFTIDGKKYSTFDENIGEKFNVGDKVVINGYQEGKYFNMKTMTIVEPIKEEKVSDNGSEDVLSVLKQILEVLKNGNR